MKLHNIFKLVSVLFLVLAINSVAYADNQQPTTDKTEQVGSLTDGGEKSTLLAAPASSPLGGQIIVDPDNPAWLKYSGGGPFFMCGPGDPEGFLYRGSQNSDGTRNGDQMSLINKLKNTGANSIYFQAIRSNGGDGNSTHNPFIDNDPNKGVNMAVLDQWETWFAEMDKNGIVVYFFFYDDSASIWNTGDKVESAEREFIQALVDRFEHHKNLIWVVAEEYQEKLSSTRVSNIAAEIRAADDHDHVIAVHKLNGLNFSEFANDPNIDQFAVQYNVGSASDLHEGMVSAWDEADGRYNLNMSEAANHGSGSTARKKNWAIAMGGAYVMVLGMNIDDTPTSDLEDCGRLVSFMETTNFTEMAPRDDLASDGTEYVLARPGNSYIAYASNLSGKIGLKDMTAGTYTFKWYDVTNGSTDVQENVNVGSGNQSWSKPSGIGSELVVYIERTGDSDAITPTAMPSPSPSPVSSPTSNPSPTSSPTPNPTVPSDSTLIFQDSFDRADSAEVGNGWIEVEENGADVGISNNRLHFIDTSDRQNRPVAKHTFEQISSGKLIWGFDFDWERGNGEGTYRLFMQLGNGAKMSDSSQDTGVGVNLVWTGIDNTHEMLGYRRDGNTLALAKLDQPSRISVTTDLDTHTYEVAIDGTVVQSQIPFDNNEVLDTVRFFTDALNEENVFNRTFDNLEIRRSNNKSTPTATPSPLATPTATPTAGDPDPTDGTISLTIEGPTSVDPGESFNASVVAKGVSVEGLYGIQLEINYDPNLVSVNNLEVNPKLSFVLYDDIDPAAGKIKVVASQEGAVSGLTGDVNLLNFNATAANISGTVTFELDEIKLSSPQASKLDTAVQSYTISVGSPATPDPTEPTSTTEPTSVPTDEPTPEPTTLPPTSTPTNEPTPQVTNEPVTSTVSGQVTLAGRIDNNWAGAVVTIDEAVQLAAQEFEVLAAEATAVTDEMGNFTIAAVAKDTELSITADAAGYLPAVCSELVVTTEEITLMPVTLVSGDINDDNSVDVTDATAIGVGFNQTGSDLASDVNQDQVVDIFDLVLVSTNFGQNGPQSWSCAN